MRIRGGDAGSRGPVRSDVGTAGRREAREDSAEGPRVAGSRVRDL